MGKARVSAASCYEETDVRLCSSQANVRGAPMARVYVIHQERMSTSEKIGWNGCVKNVTWFVGGKFKY